MEQVLYGSLHVHIVEPLSMKCLHVLYDSYGPPYPIWNRYHMVPTHAQYYFFRSPISYMEKVSYGSPHVCMVLPHMKCVHVLYVSYGPPVPYME